MTKDELSDALRGVFESPNVVDSNMEPANVVDALAKVASGLFKIAESLTSIAIALNANPK